ncbi:hypothetical protein BD779DRAFT_158881 [Infundibulicybe gibba]|nr:hypothetical protein BD779DRAFT_158881 [Infundibulicybe gibba]
MGRTGRISFIEENVMEKFEGQTGRSVLKTVHPRLFSPSPRRSRKILKDCENCLFQPQEGMNCDFQHSEASNNTFNMFRNHFCAGSHRLSRDYTGACLYYSQACRFVCPHREARQMRPVHCISSLLSPSSQRHSRDRFHAGEQFINTQPLIFP